MIQGAIFDMDGTLLDSMPFWKNAGARYLERIGIQAEPGLDGVLSVMSMPEGARYIKEKYAPRQSAEEIAAGINQIVFHAYQEVIPLKEGVREFLKCLSEKEIPMVVATSTDRKLGESAMERLGIRQYFQRVFTCTEIGKGKGEPDIYLEAARFLQSSPENIWVFEDALYAAKTVKKAGFRLVAVFDEEEKQEQGELVSLAEHYIKAEDDWRKLLLLERK